LVVRHQNPLYSARGNESVTLRTKCYEIHFCDVSDVNLILRGIREGRGREGRGFVCSGEENDALVQPKDLERGGRTRPLTDEEALEMLRGNHNSAAFVKEYERLRDDGMGVEQALIFVGHRFRMWHLRFQRVG
jgi:hypothetical protein